MYAARKGIRTGIVAERFGGQVMDTLAIENFISVKYTEGPKLVASLEEHVKEYEVDIMNLQRAEALVPAGADQLGQLVAVVDPELAEDPVEVPVDGPDGDPEPVGNLPVGQAVADECRDLPFPIGDRQGRVERPQGGRVDTAAGGQPLCPGRRLERLRARPGPVVLARGVRGGVSGEPEGAESFELPGRLVEGIPVAVAETASMGRHGRRHGAGCEPGQLAQPRGL